jgi:hypothetical protein
MWSPSIGVTRAQGKATFALAPVGTKAALCFRTVHGALLENRMSKLMKKTTSSSVAAKETGLQTRESGPELMDVDDVDADEGDGDGSKDETEVSRARRFKEVWLVEDRKSARSVWTRVGTAFENADGSWNLRLSAVPLGGRLNIRDPLPRARAAEA